MKKQVVFLMTDSTRWDMVGCYGNPAMRTPHLDRLASEGVRFDRAYTCQPVCGPARSAIFTGQFPHSCGGWTNSVSIYDNCHTIGQRLQDSGFRTAFIGKWHVDGGDYFGTGKPSPGWDPEYWYDMRCYLEELSENERRLSRKSALMDRRNVPAEFTFGHRVTDRALDFLGKYGDGDFFLTVSYDEPHDPALCPEPYASAFRDYAFPAGENVTDDLSGKPAHQRVWAGDKLGKDRTGLQVKAPRFLGCNSFADFEIGRVLEAVRAKCPDALVIYTSDHGDFLESHRLFAKGPAPYDEITRIPLIVSAPGGARGKVYPHPVSHIDLAPSILEYMGVPVPKLLEGRSILPAMRGGEERIDPEIFMEFGRYEIDHDGFGGFQPMRAVFDGRYKLAVNLLSDDELYDLEKDPGEMNNLILDPETAKIRDRLHDRLLDWMNETRDPFRGYYWERRPWRKDAREATWAYTGWTRQRENEEYEARQLDYDTGLPMEKASRLKNTGPKTVSEEELRDFDGSVSPVSRRG
ncbi:MAG: sulfatase-like hydrolase/transferase [Clostridia bacterium]|nr:sulfatase-like hydrolase/transferase [Clostridia bacterium]